MLKGPILKNLLLFAIPILISSIFQQLYNTMDTAIVGRVLGTSSLAAIGSVGSVFDLIVGFSLGIGNGLAIVTSRAYGSGDENILKKSVAGSIIIGILSSMIITIIGVIGLKPLLHLINVKSELMNEAYHYIFYIVIFIFVMFAYNLCAGLLRAIGNSMMPLVFLVFSSILNVILDYSFMKYLHMGVEGAAIATVIAQGVSVLLCIIYIMKYTKLLIPSKSHFVYDASLYKELLGQGYSMAFMMAIVNSGSVILQSGINTLDSYVIAAHTAARKAYMFFNMPFAAMSQATSTFVAQNKGANQRDRIIQGMKQAYIYDVIVAGVMTVLLLFISKPIISLISGTNHTTVLENGSLYLKIVAPNYAVLGILIQTRTALQGLGEKLIPLISSIIEFIGKIVFVILFIPTFQYMAVIFCEPVIWIVMTIQLLWSFWRNDYIRGENV